MLHVASVNRIFVQFIRSGLIKTDLIQINTR